jgi:L-malate glycosyltransferase
MVLFAIRGGAQTTINVANLVCGQKPGGTAGYVIRLLAHLNNTSDINVCLITFSENKLAKTARSLNIPVYVIQGKSTFDYKTLSKLKLIVQHENIDILHAHGYKAAVLSSLVKGKTKLIYTVHGLTDTEYTNRKVKIYNRIAYFILKYRANLIASILPSDLPQLQKMLPRQKIIATPNGVFIPTSQDVNDWRTQYRLELNIGNDEFAIGYAGRLVGRKGVDKLIRVFKLVKKWVKWAKLYIIGEGEEYRSLNQLVAELGLTNDVNFLGYRDDASKIVAAFDLVVSTSSREGIPSNLLEAIACRVPVIGYATPGVDWLLKDDKVLIPFNNQESMVKKILDIIENPEYTQTIAKEQFIRIEQEYAQKKVFDLVCDAYRELK